MVIIKLIPKTLYKRRINHRTFKNELKKSVDMLHRGEKGKENVLSSEKA